MKLTDKRVRHTRRSLRQSLIELMQRKSVNQISVKEICDLAGINRNTFYAHYSTPRDILTEIENEYYAEMNRIQESAIHSGDAAALILGIMNMLQQNREISILLYGSNSDNRAYDEYYRSAYARIMLAWIESGTKVQADHLKWLFTFLSGAIDAMIRNWVKDGMRESPEILARLAASMCNASMESVFLQHGKC